MTDAQNQYALPESPDGPTWCQKLLEQSRVPRAIIRKEDGRLVHVNGAFAQAFGYSGAELHGTPAGEVIFFVQDISEDGRWERGHLYDAHGEVLDILATARPVTNNGRDYLDYQFIEIGAFQTIGQEFLRSCETELQRIGEDLRENIGQRLTGIALLCRSLGDELADGTNERLSDGLDDVLEYINDTQKEITETIRKLQPIGMTGEGLVSALRYTARELRDVFHVECTVEAEGMKFTEAGTAINLFRIAQRAARSAARYGKADSINISLSRTDEGIELAVSDNGTGLSEEAVAHGDYGIDIMRYRARILKGRLEVTSDPRQGTTVRCVLPSDSLTPARPVN